MRWIATAAALALAACGVDERESPTNTPACAEALASCNCEPRSFIWRVVHEDGSEGTPLVICYEPGTGPLTRPSTSMFCFWTPRYDECFPP
jgi:hypothetical protein